jgi:hypothetical protein
MELVRLFSCFDPRHDTDLHTRLLGCTELEGSSVRVVDASREAMPLAGWEESLRTRLARVDLVLVSCGEHTESSLAVSGELRAAQESSTPYLMVRGRRHAPWTQPACSRADDRVYTWDWPLLLGRIAVALRRRRVPA